MKKCEILKMVMSLKKDRLTPMVIRLNKRTWMRRFRKKPRMRRSRAICATHLKSITRLLTLFKRALRNNPRCLKEEN